MTAEYPGRHRPADLHVTRHSLFNQCQGAQYVGTIGPVDPQAHGRIAILDGYLGFLPACDLYIGDITPAGSAVLHAIPGSDP